MFCICGDSSVVSWSCSHNLGRIPVWICALYLRGTAWFFPSLFRFSFQYLPGSSNVIFALSAEHKLLVWNFCTLCSTEVRNGFPPVVYQGSIQISSLCHLEESNSLRTSLAEYHSCCCSLLAEGELEEILSICFTLCFWCIHRNKPISTFFPVLCWKGWHFYLKQECTFAFSGCRIQWDKLCNMNL